MGAPDSTPRITEASPAQVHQWLTAGEATLIDVREPDEHAREHIKGSILHPLSGLEPARATASARHGQRLVFHCRSGHRSADACRRAAAATDATIPIINMTGGIEAWKRDALPIERNAAACGISIMRQVQLVVGIGVVAGSALAFFIHPAFIAIPAFFGAGLTVAGATGTCALATILGLMPWNRAPR